MTRAAAKAACSLAITLAIALASFGCAKTAARNSDSTTPIAPPPPAVRAAARNDSATVVTPDGYGSIRIGATLADLSAAVGSPVPASRTQADRDCRYVLLSSLPKGMRLMLVHDSVARIDVDAPGPRTAEGVGVGDTEADAMRAYGARATIRPNKYTGPVGHDITAVPRADTTRRVVFETNGAMVTRYRAGKEPAIDFAEGCG